VQDMIYYYYYYYNHFTTLWILSGINRVACTRRNIHSLTTIARHLGFLVQSEDNIGRRTNNPDGLHPY